jgi:ABC-type Fe3+ transport system substrate-binding protein
VIRLTRPALILGLLLAVACAPAAAPSPTAAPAKPTESKPAATSAPAKPTEAPAAKPAEAKPALSKAEGPAASPAAKTADPSWLADYVAAAKTLKTDAAEFEKLKEAAKKEGKVTVSGPGFPGLRQGMIDGFQKAYGITLEYQGLGGGEVVTRVEREARAGTVSIDVNIGGTSTCWIMAERGYIRNAAEVVKDPELAKPEVWRYGAPRLILPSPQLPRDFFCGVQAAEWVMTDLFVNSQTVRLDTIRSWKDLLKPEYKGKIASWDPRRPGSSQTTVGYLNALFGEQYLRDLYIGQQVVLTADYRQLAEWVARGTHPFGIGLVQANIEQFRKEGLPLERLFPADGQGSLTGGFGTVHPIKNSQNPNAGALFVNWFASKDAQEIWEREMMETSLRNDLPHRVPEYVIPKQGVEYPINDYYPGYFFDKRAPAIAKINELLGR